MRKILLFLLIILTCVEESKSQVQISDSTASLYRFIKEWWDVPYAWGGTTKRGIDCSAFVKTMYKKLHGKDLPRTSGEQYKFVTKINKEDLKTGDLVFFKADRRISHVGYYLFDSLFVHSASKSKGVTISNLYDSAYKKSWYSQGRVN